MASFIACLTQWYFTRMCFIFLWLSGSLATSRVPRLSQKIKVGAYCLCPSSAYKLLSQDASFAPSYNAIYSASVVDAAVTSCLLDLHVIAPPAHMKTYPDVDL